VKLVGAVRTDVGCVREHNEDDSLILEDHGLYVVADGMGGHACGEVASAISVDSMEVFYSDEAELARVSQTYKEQRGEGELADVSSVHEFRLQSAIEYGNLQIYREASQNPKLEDMGTTIVAISFVGSRVYVGHVGDSRAYRYRSGKLEQLTEDHSLANEFIRMNVLRPEDLPRFPYKNVIVRAMGLQAEVIVDTDYRTCRPGDRYMMCSDGLSDLVSDDEILQVLDTAETVESCCEALVAKALDYGGVDNVTVLVVEVS
jgi:protein phosphatase